MVRLQVIVFQASVVWSTEKLFYILVVNPFFGLQFQTLFVKNKGRSYISTLVANSPC